MPERVQRCRSLWALLKADEMALAWSPPAALRPGGSLFR
jgi:hypothetical protein